MTLTQLTHHDLDGYGASTVVGAVAEVRRVVHVSRYPDVGPVVATELERLSRREPPETLLVTDLGLEPVAVKFIKDFAVMNLRRPADRHHRLVVLDHHASSVDQLAAQGVRASTPDAAAPSLKSFDLGDPAIVVIVDETRSATRLAFDHRSLFAAKEPAAAGLDDLATLVEAIDAVDLWKKDRPIFRRALVLDEVFWENVASFIPPGHPWHDRFVGALLLGMADLLRSGAPPARIESEVGALRARVIDAMLEGTPDDDREQTTRMRIAPVLARSPELFRRLSNGALLSFGLESGTFQRVSDAVMSQGTATLVANVQRAGTVSFRSNDETALDAARKLRGGGHKDAAGGRLASGAVVSLDDAVAQIEPVLDPPKPDPSRSAFAALQGWKG